MNPISLGESRSITQNTAHKPVVGFLSEKRAKYESHVGESYSQKG